MNPRFIIQRKISDEDWSNFKLEPEGGKKKADKRSKQVEPLQSWDFDAEDQPIPCEHFGCGKSLSLRESLFSNHCIAHQSPPSFTSLVEGYI